MTVIGGHATNGNVFTCSDDGDAGVWTKEAQIQDTSEGLAEAALFWKRATADSAGATITVSGFQGGGIACGGYVVVYRGVVASGNPIEAGPSTQNSSATPASITTLSDSAMVCYDVFSGSSLTGISNQSCTSPGSLTERIEKSVNASGIDLVVAHASALKATAGATGAFSHTGTGDCGFAYALTPIPFPVITDQPDDVREGEGETATFSVAATGTGTLTYQWQRATDAGGSTQFARPSSDISNDGGYTATEGSDLWDELEEASADDASSEVISPNGTGTRTFEVGLSSLIDPGVHTGHVIRVRHKMSLGGSSVTLKQGGTTIAIFAAGVGSVYATVTYTLSEAEAAAITDYGALSIHYSHTNPITSQAVVTWLEFEVPGEPATFSDIGGATSDSFTTETLDGNDDGDLFRCNVTDDNGTTASASARLGVDNVTTAPPAVFHVLLVPQAWF